MRQPDGSHWQFPYYRVRTQEGKGKLMNEGPCHRQFTVAWELFRGFDSIPTIHQKYERGGYRGLGALKCPHPDCSYARFDVWQLWQHVHFAKKHDRFGERKREWDEYIRDLHR